MIQKLKAFTIIEVLVVVLISSIAVGTAATAYLLIQRYYGNFSTIYKHNYEVTSFHAILQNDIDRSHHVSGDSYNMYMFSDKDTLAKYTIENECVVRTCPLLTDTFRLQVKNTDIKTINAQTDYINTVSFTISHDGEDLTMRFDKIYSHKVLFTLDMKNKLIIEN